VTLSDQANGVVVADAIRWVGPLLDPGQAPAAAPATTSAASRPGAPADANALWTVTLKAAELLPARP
jgi:hypothetical protein